MAPERMTHRLARAFVALPTRAGLVVGVGLIAAAFTTGDLLFSLAFAAGGLFCIGYSFHMRRSFERELEQLD